MRTRRTIALVAVVALTPVFCGVVAVAAGHVLWSHVDQPVLVAAYCGYRLDRVIVSVNAALCAAVVGAAVSLLPLRRSLATTLAVLSALASLPAYSLAYNSSIHVAEWLGLGWSSSA